MINTCICKHCKEIRFKQDMTTVNWIHYPICTYCEYNHYSNHKTYIDSTKKATRI